MPDESAPKPRSLPSALGNLLASLDREFAAGFRDPIEAGWGDLAVRQRFLMRALFSSDKIGDLDGYIMCHFFLNPREVAELRPLEKTYLLTYKYALHVRISDPGYAARIIKAISEQHVFLDGLNAEEKRSKFTSAFVKAHASIPKAGVDSDAKPDGGKGETADEGGPRISAMKPTVKTPQSRAIAAYRAMLVSEGINQDEAARRFGVSQSTISRWKRDVEKWVGAGNVLPDLAATPTKIITMDPRKLGIGKRKDGRKPD